jgi:CHASE1-domain containing sensor protein
MKSFSLNTLFPLSAVMVIISLTVWITQVVASVETNKSRIDNLETVIRRQSELFFRIEGKLGKMEGKLDYLVEERIP